MRSSIVMRVDPDGDGLSPHVVELDGPPVGWVTVRVAASGVCFADVATSRTLPSESPITPGHEIAGEVVAVGAGVETGWIGERVAVGWFGGSCTQCSYCRAGDPVHCHDRKIPGLSYPGGWAEFVTVPEDALARVPDELSLFDAAPLGCAGVTTFNAIRRANVAAGGRVAVFGIGGLGHLAVQFAARMGYEVVVIARGMAREPLARQLGAHHYIDAESTEAGEVLRSLGGADLLLSTASTTEPLAGLLPGLRVGGRLCIVGVDGGVLEVPTAVLTMKSIVVTGHLTGSARDIEETMRFAVLNNVRPIIERMPLEEAAGAVERLTRGNARFRIVLDATSER
ncbi:MAG TPA: alcohol dehydrogenase catalytic domain-containing protein [Arachnia sp.]|nr:alcohol dehydrogenase catalytic domain-containing protein [Arachnia sp.]HMT87131.1 alcohol dehydrogenase catalytic domain-containing protein [Arachnia sp.]